MTGLPRVSIRLGDQVVAGRVVLCSGNRKSLLVELEEPLHTSSGGLYANLMPLLMRADGAYEDLLEGCPMRVTWEQEVGECPSI